ncbi:MAG: hypothetical protein M9950_13295 [Thermomicrobiales bacterium]|nr:hypothetical protein [Thermomicrobiales bacterium]
MAPTGSSLATHTGQTTESEDHTTFVFRTTLMLLDQDQQDEDENDT